MKELFERLTGWTTANAQHFSYREFPAGGPAAQPLPVYGSYFQISLSQFFLARNRNWFQQLYPAAHTAVRLQYADFEPVELSHVTHLPKDGLGKGVSLNHPVTGLIPYNGGTVEIFCGLIALQGQDYLDGAIQLLASFSGLVAGPVSQAIVVAGKVASSVHDLIVGNNGAVHLNFHQSYTAAPGGANLAPGHVAVILATAAQLANAQLSVQNDQLMAGGQPLTGYDYLLFRIDGLQERPDWRMREIEEYLGLAARAYLQGKQQDGDDYRAAALVAVYQSPDLAANDRRRVAKRINEELDAVAGDLGAAGEAPADLSLNAIMSVGALSWQHAAALGPPSLRETLTAGR
ncbi:MAG: hypothetical protein ACRDHL_10945 [Candidatus Promineifilaceae bacterium]